MYQKWLTKLLFVVKCKKDKDNMVVDVLSRKWEEEHQLAALSFPTTSWLADVKASYLHDPMLQKHWMTILSKSQTLLSIN